MSKVYKTKPPCVECDKKGCGSYHDQCEKYKKWKEEDYVEKSTGYFKIRGKSKNRYCC